MNLLKILIFFTILSAVGCRGCTLEEMLANVNNGNVDPEKLILELNGTSVATALSQRYGADCSPSPDFDAQVEILVRTASIVNGQIVVDPEPYSEIDVDVAFSGGTQTNTFEVEVPETGGYGVLIQIEFIDCDFCCHGAQEGQCGDDVDFGNNQCEAGKPQVALEQVFTTETRPAFDLNWIPLTSELAARDCRACGCFVECE